MSDKKLSRAKVYSKTGTLLCNIDHVSAYEYPAPSTIELTLDSPSGNGPVILQDYGYIEFVPLETK